MISQLIAFILFLILILIFLIWQQIKVGVKKLKELKKVQSQPPPPPQTIQDEEPVFNTESDDFSSITSLDMLNALEGVQNNESLPME